jgi:hypothetical protein
MQVISLPDLADLFAHNIARFVLIAFVAGATQVKFRASQGQAFT